MKNETTSVASEINETKQVWAAPTLTMLSLPLDTLAMSVMGGDGSGNNGMDLT